jgi:hypothetical protein
VKKRLNIPYQKEQSQVFLYSKFTSPSSFYLREKAKNYTILSLCHRGGEYSHFLVLSLHYTVGFGFFNAPKILIVAVNKFSLYSV